MKPPTRFTGENYTTWAFRFEQWMQWKDLWNVFTSNPPGDEETEDIKATWKRKNAQGYSALTLSIGEDELHAIREFKDKVNSSKLSWEILRARCVQKPISTVLMYEINLEICVWKWANHLRNILHDARK